jgi:TonB-linked SusC/RagA family outer membrane protein
VLGNENMNAGDPAKRDIYNDGYYVSRLLSYYGRLNYVLRDKYLFTFTMRADGSTKFGNNNKWGYFPSGAVSWKMHNEPWLNQIAWLSELKLRASYGQSGNQGINSYQTLDRYGMEKFWNDGQWKTVIGPGYEVGRTGADNRYMVWGGIKNPDLKWETTTQTDIGIDAAFLKNRLRLTVDAYYKQTTNLLREKYLTLSSSYDKMWVNEGEVLNKGFEISVEGDAIATKDWGLTTGIIFSLNRNKVTDLGDPVSSGLSMDYLTGMYYEITGPAISMFNQNASIYGIGQPMNVFYGYLTDGIIQRDEDPGFIDPDGLRDRPGELKYVDLTGDYTITPDDRTIIGDPNPEFTGSFNASARWKNLDMAITLYGVYGNDVLYNNYTFSPRIKARRWTPDNPTNDYPRLNNNRQYLLSSYFVMDGSYLRIQNVNIGYVFNIDRLLKSVRLFANIDNLFTFTRFNGYDPEVGLDGIYWGGYPKFRKYTVGIDIKF